MAHQFTIIDDYHEGDASRVHVVLTDDNDDPITTTVEWEARFELLDDPTAEETTIEKTSQDGEITFESTTEDDVADLEGVSTGGEKAVVLIDGESVDGVTVGDTADLLGTGDGRAEQATYYYAVRTWDENGDRSTAATGEILFIAPGVQ